MKLTSIDVQQQRFRKGLRGYAPTEVDEFLNLVAEELAETTRALNQARDEAKTLERELEEHRERDTTMREALLTAQKAMDEVRQHAQKDAQLIVSEAELKAEQIIHSAHLRVENILRDIQDLKLQRARAIEEMRGVLATHVKLLEVHDETVKLDQDTQEGELKVLDRLRAPAAPAVQPEERISKHS